jgi:hypothetical protein
MIKAKYISKKKVLEAIKNEPLYSGEWAKIDANGKVMRDKDCPVCAVGATLRKAGFSNNEVSRFGRKMSDHGDVAPDFLSWEGAKDMKQYVLNCLANKEYLHALSIKFEDQADKTGVGKKTRSVLVNFVEKNFPNRIKLDPKF